MHDWSTHIKAMLASHNMLIFFIGPILPAPAPERKIGPKVFQPSPKGAPRRGSTPARHLID